MVRSGILNSVHTFANDPSRGIYILTFLLVLVLLSFAIFIIYENKNFIQKSEIFTLSKETAVLINNWFSIDTSNKLRNILRKVVSSKDGTAILADKDGYSVGGKTGTAESYGDKKNRINTFISVFLKRITLTLKLRE